MDDAAPRTVVYGTIATSVTSAVIVGAMTAIAGRPLPTIAAGFAAFNSGMSAVTFFGIREFIVGPVLVHIAPWQQYAKRRKQLSLSPLNESSESGGTSYRDLEYSAKSNKLLDSGISGALTGGITRSWKSGRKAIVPGALLGFAVCLGIQYGFNYAVLSRSRDALRKDDPSNLPAPNDESTESLDVALGRRALQLFGLKPTTDEEVLQKMKDTKAAYERRILELEKRIEEERKSSGYNS